MHYNLFRVIPTEGMSMLERKMMSTLCNWRNAADRRALLLSGARQTGKTYLVREFARRHFENLIEVDFVADKDAGGFLAAAAGPQDLLSRLTLLSRKAATPGSTLVFLDEVQAAPEVITLVKYLVEDGRFDVVLSGSLLGVELENVRSLPVGYVASERMHPLDFEEFCWSQGVPAEMLDQVGECYASKEPVEDTLHERLVELFRLYVVIGGMPHAVQRYIDTSYDLGAVRAVQASIVELYRDDISKYAKGRSLQIKAIFDQIPNELAKENKRFHMKALKEKAEFGDFEADFLWLTNAGVALPAYLTGEPKFPLRRTQRDDRFKLYASDVGLLMQQYPRGVAMDVMGSARSVNFGSVYENAVAQQLAAHGSVLRYYYNNRKGEVDFLVETGESRVVPVEVKSGKDYKLHLALNNLLRTADYGIESACVLSERNVSTVMREGKPVYYLPLYMAHLVAREAVSEREGVVNALEGVTVPPPEWD